MTAAAAAATAGLELVEAWPDGPVLAPGGSTAAAGAPPPEPPADVVDREEPTEVVSPPSPVPHDVPDRAQISAFFSASVFSPHSRFESAL